MTKYANLANVSVGTVRRWVDIYARFLTPGANPPKGQTRLLSPHDQRVLYYVACMRDNGTDQDTIIERLSEMQEKDFGGLPELPVEWGIGEETVPVGLAISRASEVVQAAVLQKELQHTQQTLALAEARVGELEIELSHAAGRSEQLEAEKTNLLVQVEQLKGEVARLEGRLAGYSFGREKPVNVGFIIVAALLAGAVVVLVAMLLTALIL